MTAFLDKVLGAGVPASPQLADEMRGVADLDARFDALVRAGRAAHPSIVVEEVAWARYLARHLRAGSVVEQLTELRPADVHLVLGCSAGDGAALSLLDARLRAVAAQALSGIRLGSLSIDELLQDVRVKLLVGEAGQTKLESYSGRGVLDGWLRVTLARTALSRLRTVESALPSAPSAYEDDALTACAGSHDPQLELLRARSAPIVKQAIEAAIAALPSAERALLRLHVVDGLSMIDLAAVYDVHRATIARRVAKARSEVFESARIRASEALGIDEAEFASLIGAVMSQIDLTLRGVLDATTSER